MVFRGCVEGVQGGGVRSQGVFCVTKMAQFEVKLDKCEPMPRALLSPNRSASRSAGTARRRSRVWVAGARPRARDVHSFTFRLNVSAFGGIRGVKGVLRGYWGVLRGQGI